MDYIQNERNVMHLQREPDKPDRISWVFDVISIWFHKFQSDILSRILANVTDGDRALDQIMFNKEILKKIIVYMVKFTYENFVVFFQHKTCDITSGRKTLPAWHRYSPVTFVETLFIQIFYIYQIVWIF